MRLWTLHPRYLDAKGLVAAWREALLAQAVLRGRTRGYRHHPQLDRFLACPKPLSAMGSFLAGIAEEAARRGYRFDDSRITRSRLGDRLDETEGQLLGEWRHLLEKLKARAPEDHRRHHSVLLPDPHPLFRIVPGTTQPWEKSPVAVATGRIREPFRRTIRATSPRLGSTDQFEA